MNMRTWLHFLDTTRKGNTVYKSKKMSAVNESFTCIFPIVYFIMNIKPNGFENRVSAVLIAVGKLACKNLFLL